jgi:hypothetical protein
MSIHSAIFLFFAMTMTTPLAGATVLVDRSLQTLVVD